MKNKNTTSAQTELFNLSTVGKELIGNHELNVVQNQMTPHASALDAIIYAFSRQDDMRKKFVAERESLGAVIERVLPDIAGADLPAKRKVIREHLIADGRWDKKYISETLSRIFRLLDPSTKQNSGSGAKADPAIVALAEQARKENPDMPLADLAKRYRAISTRLDKLAKEEAAAAASN